MVLKSHENVVADPDAELADGPHRTAAGHDVDQAEPLVLVISLHTKRPTQDLQSGADGHHVRTVIDASDKAFLRQQVTRESLGSVFSATHQVDVRRGKFVGHGHQLQ